MDGNQMNHMIQMKMNMDDEHGCGWDGDDAMDGMFLLLLFFCDDMMM